MEDLGAPPPSLEEETAAPPIPKSKAAGPVPKVGGTETTHESVNYTSAAERCETCEYFDEDAMQCKKHKFDAEPEGHCDSFTLLGDAGGEEMPAGEGEEDLGLEDLDFGDTEDEEEEEVY
jgi:hypothetical protein